MDNKLSSAMEEQDEIAILRERVALYEAWFRAIDQNSNFDFWFKNADSNYTYVNPHFARTMQKEKFVLENTPLRELFEEDRFKRIQKLDQQVMHDEYLERVIPCDASGTLEMHEEQRFAVKDETGTTIGLGCFAFEVTDKSIAEQTLQQAEKLAKLCSWRWNAETNALISCSEHLAEFLGVSPTDTFKAFPNRLKDYVVEEDKHVFQPVLDCMNGASNEGYEIEYRIQKPNGVIVYVLEKAEPISTSNNSTEYLGFLKDISHQKMAEEALRVANQELESKVRHRTSELQAAKEKAEKSSEAKSRFLASISHEFRTPLNAIIGFSEIIAKQRLGPIENKEYADISQHALNSGYDLLKLIENILTISGDVELSHARERFEPVSLISLIDMSLEHVKADCNDKNVSIIWSKPEKDFTLNANKDRLSRVLKTVLCNATTYNKKGGFIKIKAYAAEANHAAPGVVIDITDTGIGIAQDDLKNLMTPFYKVDNTSTTSYDGAGLGLAVAKKLVEMHQGKISIASKLGKGTVVRIVLPAEVQSLETGKDVTDLLLKQLSA